MAQANDELLGELYGLRAGLSALSEEMDEIRSIQQKTEKEERKLMLTAMKSDEYGSNTAYEIWAISQESAEMKKTVKQFRLDLKFLEQEFNYGHDEETEKKRVEQSALADKVYKHWIAYGSDVKDYFTEAQQSTTEEEIKRAEKTAQIVPNALKNKWNIFNTIFFFLLAAVSGFFLFWLAPISAIGKPLLLCGGIFGAALLLAFATFTEFSNHPLLNGFELYSSFRNTKFYEYCVLGIKILGALGCAGATISLFISNREEPYIVCGLLFGVCAACALISLLYLFSCLAVVYHRSRMVKKEQKQIDALKSDLDNVDKSAHVKTVMRVRQRLSVILDEQAVAIKPHVALANSIQKSLVKTFAETLDERDWQHLDLIIYEVETGRASTIKEALIQVDNELRTQRIEKAIQTATDRICNTLRTGFSRLSQQIESCCNRLSQQIESVGNQIVSSNNEVIRSNNMIVDEMRLNNALMEKSNTTSAQLMDDVKQMRVNSDYLTMRVRNGI